MYTKKKESIDIQIKYFFPVYINALLNKLFIDNKRHHACIIPFLFLPQLCKLPFDSNIVDISLHHVHIPLRQRKAMQK